MQNNNNKKTICCLAHLSRIRARLSDPHSPCHEDLGCSPSAGGWPWAAGAAHQRHSFAPGSIDTAQRGDGFSKGGGKQNTTPGINNHPAVCKMQERDNFKSWFMPASFSGLSGENQVTDIVRFYYTTSAQPEHQWVAHNQNNAYRILY